MSGISLESIVSLAVGFASLAGVAGLITALVNLLKHFGIVADGSAEKWYAGLSLAAFAGIVLVGVFRPDVSLSELDGIAAQITILVLFVGGLLAQLGLGKAWHAFLRGTPVIGKSFSK